MQQPHRLLRILRPPCKTGLHPAWPATHPWAAMWLVLFSHDGGWDDVPADIHLQHNTHRQRLSAAVSSSRAASRDRQADVPLDARASGMTCAGGGRSLMQRHGKHQRPAHHDCCGSCGQGVQLDEAGFCLARTHGPGSVRLPAQQQPNPDSPLIWACLEVGCVCVCVCVRARACVCVCVCVCVICTWAPKPRG